MFFFLWLGRKSPSRTLKVGSRLRDLGAAARAQAVPTHPNPCHGLDTARSDESIDSLSRRAVAAAITSARDRGGGGVGRGTEGSLVLVTALWLTTPIVFGPNRLTVDN